MNGRAPGTGSLALFLSDAPHVIKAVACRPGLPGFVIYVVAAVDGEVVGFVGVVLVVGIEGADANHIFGSQVGDGDRLAGLGIGAGVDGGGAERCQFGEGLDPGAGLGAAVCADEVVLEAAVYGAELRRRGSVGDDAVSRRREGRAGVRLRLRIRGGRVGTRLVRARLVAARRVRAWLIAARLVRARSVRGRVCRRV